MKDVRIGLSTLFIVSALASAAAFALGRSTSSSPQAATREPDPAPEPAPQSFPPTQTAAAELPVGHPPVDPSATPLPAPPATNLTWKVPNRWETLPNPSTMRLATYRPARAAGDTADADVSVTQAGGSVGANADRWVGQFDADAQKSAKRTTKTIAGLEVTIVEVEGTFGGGMGAKSADAGYALLGAIVATPGMPHFFKITGPKKTVQQARPDLDALLATMTIKR